MKHISFLFYTFLLFSLLFSLAGPPSSVIAASRQKKKHEQQYVTIDFADVDIDMFIKYISELTGKNFIVDRTVKGKITVIAPTKMSEKDAYRVFESVLEVHGYATVPSGPIIKIVPAVQARSKSIPTVQAGEKIAPDDKIVTQIIPLKHADPSALKKVLAPLISKTSVVIAHSESSMLLITDIASNINRLMEIIKVIDVPSVGEELVIIPLKYASANDVSKSISKLFIRTARKGSRQKAIKVIPYERTNSLIIFAPKTEIEKIRDLLKQLDTEITEGGGGKIHVYYLQHANAEELVKVLTSLPKKQAVTKAKTVQSVKKNTNAPPLSTDLNITADPETNSLIVTAPKEDYLVLEDIIKKLDIPRRMVYLEALIMEVSIDKEFQLGVEWGGSGSFHNGTGTIGSGFTDSGFNLVKGIGSGIAGMANGATLGILKKGIEIGGIYFPDIGAVLNAFKTDSDINIIATPQILTTDNKEASITVGQNVPYITSKNNSDSGSTQDYTNYEYKDVGTTLKITPQINQANLLRLEIAVEVTRLKGEAGGATPTTYKRTANTTVVVHNEEIVVIGGMIGHDITSSNYKVPLLSDIPVLGWLFKTHDDSDRKTNMFIFIAPRIVESSPELANIYADKRELMETAHKGSGNVPENSLRPASNKKHAFPLIDMGFAQLQKKKYAEAARYFRKALNIDPENPHALMNMGIVYERKGRKDKAAKFYQQVIDITDLKKDIDGAKQRVNKSLRKTAREHLRKLKRRR